MTLSCLRVSAFSSNEDGHGGNRRSAQLHRLLQRANIYCDDFDISHFAPPSPSRLPTRLARFSRVARCTQATVSNLTNLDTYSFALCENPDVLHVTRALSHQLPIIATPHNIEAFLIDRQGFKIDSKYSSRASLALAREATALLMSSFIFTISNEDSWLLANYGIDSCVLPYFPSPKLVETLSQIRKSKKPLASATIKGLVLGTVGNPCTLNGIKQLFAILSHVRLPENIEILVAGYGTENLREYAADGIQIIGTYQPSQITELFSVADFAIIHQDYGTGSLTKIPELLCAGIPILANRHAVRSYCGHGGIYVYQHLSQFQQALNNLLVDLRQGLPALPPPIDCQEDLFIRTCQMLQ